MSRRIRKPILEGARPMQKCRIAAGGFLLLLLAMFPSQPTAAAPQDEAIPATAGESAPEREHVEQPELREALLARMAKDQEARKAFLAWDRQNKAASKAAAERAEESAPFLEMVKTDRENREWLKTIVERHGWPGKTLVGTDGAHAPGCSYSTPISIFNAIACGEW